MFASGNRLQSANKRLSRFCDEVPSPRHNAHWKYIERHDARNSIRCGQSYQLPLVNHQVILPGHSEPKFSKQDGSKSHAWKRVVELRVLSWTKNYKQPLTEPFKFKDEIPDLSELANLCSEQLRKLPSAALSERTFDWGRKQDKTKVLARLKTWNFPWPTTHSSERKWVTLYRQQSRLVSKQYVDAYWYKNCDEIANYSEESRKQVENRVTLGLPITWQHQRWHAQNAFLVLKSVPQSDPEHLRSTSSWCHQHTHALTLKTKNEQQQCT